MKYALFIGLLLSVAGCANYTAFKAVEKNAPTRTGDSVPVEVDQVPECVVDLPQAQLDGNVNSFEFKNAFGVVFGYNPGGDHNPVSGDLNIKVSQSQMDLIMFGSDPLNQVLLASSQVGANQTNTNIGVNIDFNQFKVDPTLYFDTPLAAVSDNAIKKVVKDLGKSMGSLPWIGRVIKKIDDRTLLVNAGSLSGLQAGDEFEIYHVDHFWTGQPCQSAYLGSRREPAQPVATIKISQVGSITSVGLLNIPKQGIIKRGSEVVIKKLVGEKRNLKKKVRLGVISAKPIQLPGGVTFDLEPVINVQFINGVRQSSEFAF